MKGWQVAGPFLEVHGKGAGWVRVMIAKLVVEDEVVEVSTPQEVLHSEADGTRPNPCT